MDKIYQVTDIFTPTTPAKLNFVERHDINKRIVRALKTPGTQIIVYGPSGSGKTTLLENKLFQVYEKHLKTSCMKGMSFESVMLDAFDQLSVFYLSESSSADATSVEASIKANYQLIDTQIRAMSTKSKSDKLIRTLPPQLTAQNLARFMGEAGYCWILDDFHKIKGESKEDLSQLMKVFMDMSNDYRDLKIICVGAENTARQVVQYDGEMKERVAEIKVPLMTFEEVNRIIRKGVDLLNVEIESKELCEDIYHYSNGLPSICHKLCLLMSESLDITETIYIDTEEMAKIHDTEIITRVQESGSPRRMHSGEKFDSSHLAYAIGEYLDDASDTIKRSFDNAFSIEQAPIVLEAISECGAEGECIDGILDIIDSMGWRMEVEEVESILQELQSECGGNIVRFDTESRIYCFTNPFLMTFSRTLFDLSSYRPKMSQGELFQIFNNAFSSMKSEYDTKDIH